MKIAVIGDLHYPALKENYAFIENDRKKFYESFIKKFFSVSADLYVSIGDLTNFGLADELDDVYAMIDEQGKSFIHVLGNHDVYGLKRNDVLSITKQERFRVVKTDKAVLAFLDTAREQDYEVWGGTLAKEQLDWLTEVVEQSGELPLLVFAHHPVYATTMNSEKDNLSVHPDIPLWDILQKKQGIGLYVNGHNHYNSIAKREQWTFVQLAAVLDQQAARTIDITDSSIQIEPVDLSDENLSKQAQVIGDAIDHFRLNPHQLGTEADIRHTIPLKTTIVK